MRRAIRWSVCWRRSAASIWRPRTCSPVRFCSRDLRDRRAVARYGGLTGSPDESGAKRRERGLARAGNARVRHGMIQLAWRFLWHQPECALVKWYQARAGTDRSARKRLIALWRFVTQGLVPEGVIFNQAG